MRSVSKRRLGTAVLICAAVALLTGLTDSRSHDAPTDFTAPPEGPWRVREDDDLLIDFVFKTQNIGNLAMAVTNHAFLGDNFANRDPSMEYPKGSEVDHLVRGGLWVGGINTNFDTLVTTGVQDGYWGTYARHTEWVPRGISPAEINYGWIRERSSLPTSPYFDPQNAVSEQDLVTGFVDLVDHEHTPEQGNADTYHTATGIEIHQESYAWSYEPADAMVLFKWTLVPNRTLLQSYFAIYAELTTGWKGKYPIGDWPPSSANWFHHHLLYWVDDLEAYSGLSPDPFNLVAEHHYTYDEGMAPQHAGIKFLGAKYRPAGGEWIEEVGQVTWRWWDWEPGSYTRDNDSEKYALLAQEGTDDWTTILASPDNSGDSPCQILCAGPWDLFGGDGVEDGDTLEISFALLAGDNFDDLVQNALYAQDAYNKGFAIASPPHSPRCRVTTDRGVIRLLWEGSPELSFDSESGYDFEGYRIYVGRDGQGSAFELLRDFDLSDLPARNPDLQPGIDYFSQEWLDSLLAGDPASTTIQEALDARWPEIYTYHEDAQMPHLVTEVDSIGYNTGFESVLLPEDEWITETDGEDSYVFKYAYTLDDVSDGHHYFVSVTSYDQGSESTKSLESGLSQNASHVIPGPAPGNPITEGVVSVFPNPYRGSAVWDTNRATGRYVWFVGLPERAKIRIFTLAGDLVTDIHFDRDTYVGANAAGVYAGGEGDRVPVLSGSMAAWDLRTRSGQPVSTGLYLFSVTNLESGEAQQGKFLVLK